jgi:hypothetical protein
VAGKPCRWKKWPSPKHSNWKPLGNVLERRGVVWKAEVLEEIKQLREKSVRAR